MGSKKLDPDIKALRAAIRAISKSSSKRMLHANMNYLWDLFVAHPPKELPDNLKKETKKQGPLKVVDPDGTLRNAAISINLAISGDNDYAGGVRYAIRFVEDMIKTGKIPAMSEALRK